MMCTHTRMFNVSALVVALNVCTTFLHLNAGSGHDLGRMLQPRGSVSLHCNDFYHSGGEDILNNITIKYF